MRPHHLLASMLLGVPLLHCALPMMPQQPGQQGLQDPSAGAGAPGAPQTTGAGFAPSSAASPSSASSPSAPESKAAGGAPSAPVPTSIEIHSDCTKTTPVFYGDKPKFGGGTKSSIGSNTTTSATRKSDGTLTVWIIDEQENGIASVKVSPSTAGSRSTAAAARSPHADQFGAPAVWGVETLKSELLSFVSTPSLFRAIEPFAGGSVAGEPSVYRPDVPVP